MIMHLVMKKLILCHTQNGNMHKVNNFNLNKER